MAKQLEDLRADIGVLTTEDLMKRVMEIRQRRRTFPAEKRRATKKEGICGINKMGASALLKLLEILESENEST